MPPPDHGFRGPRRVSAPNGNFFRFTVVNCATLRVTQHGVSFLRFEELLTAKGRKIGVKFTSKTPTGGSDFLRRGFGRQSENKVIILFHTSRSVLRCRNSHRDSGSDTSIFRHRAVKINGPASAIFKVASRWRAHGQRLEFRALRNWVRCERAGRPAFAFPIPSSMDEAQA